MNFTYNDRDVDIATRTLLGEAGGEGWDGMAAVAHVLRNRTMDGRWGSSVADTALQPQQFSTWNSGAGGNNGASGADPNSEAYKRAAGIVREVFDGQIPDMTEGATHYYSPGGMDALVSEGSQSSNIPGWLQQENDSRGGSPTRIGGHQFTGRVRGYEGPSTSGSSGGDISTSVINDDGTVTDVGAALLSNDTASALGHERPYDLFANEVPQQQTQPNYNNMAAVGPMLNSGSAQGPGTMTGINVQPAPALTGPAGGPIPQQATIARPSEPWRYQEGYFPTPNAAQGPAGSPVPPTMQVAPMQGAAGGPTMPIETPPMLSSVPPLDQSNGPVGGPIVQQSPPATIASSSLPSAPITPPGIPTQSLPPAPTAPAQVPSPALATEPPSNQSEGFWSRFGSDGWLTQDRQDKLLAIGTGILSGNDWQSGLAGASQNLMDLRNGQRQEEAIATSDATSRDNQLADQATDQANALERINAQAAASAANASPVPMDLLPNIEMDDGSYAANLRFNGDRIIDPDGNDVTSRVVARANNSTADGGRTAATMPQAVEMQANVLSGQTSIERMDRLLGSLDKVTFGAEGAAVDVGAMVSTIFGNDLSPEALQRAITQGDTQALIGLIREDVVGPGVMTEPDAMRILSAIGGDLSILSNPQVAKQLIGQIREESVRNYEVQYGQYESMRLNSPQNGYSQLPRYQAPAPLDQSNGPGALSGTPPSSYTGSNWEY